MTPGDGSPEWHVDQAERWLEGACGDNVSAEGQLACAALANAHLKVADIKLMWRLRGEDHT